MGVRQGLKAIVAAATVLFAGSCGDSVPASRPETPRATPSRASADASSRSTVVFLGDSLTAGLGLDSTSAYPSLLQTRMDREGYEYEVVNAGVSGDTTAGGLRRVAWSLDARTRVLVVALGANDGLRGLPPSEMKGNLSAIIDAGQKAGATVLLAGMEAPPNNGPEYTAAFRRVYTDLARERGVPLIPFLLDGVAGDPALNQDDGIHPNQRGAARVAETVWRALQPVLQKRTQDTR